MEKKAGAFEKRLESIGINALQFNNIEEALERFNSQIQNIIQHGIAFETDIKELQAVIGITGDKLTELATKAKEMSMQFGGAPAENLAVYIGLTKRSKLSESLLLLFFSLNSPLLPASPSNHQFPVPRLALLEEVALR